MRTRTFTVSCWMAFTLPAKMAAPSFTNCPLTQGRSNRLSFRHVARIIPWRLSLDDLPLTESPVESVRSALHRDHSEALVGRVPRGISGYDNLISDF
jgi:hypothetical protein